MQLEPKVSKPIRIHYVRHAETDENILKPPRFGGPDARITDAGREQAVKLGKYLHRHQIKPALIFASSYIRAYETAEILAAAIGYPEVEIVEDERLREIGRGDWTGQLYSEVLTEAELQSLRGNALDHCPPNGESMRQVSERMHASFMDIAQALEVSGRLEAIVVSHGRAIQALHAVFSQCRPELGWRYVIENTSVTTFSYHLGDGWRIDRINARPHLGW